MPSEKANEFADYWCSDYMNEARMAEDFDDYVAAAVAEEREALADILNHWARSGGYSLASAVNLIRKRGSDAE